MRYQLLQKNISGGYEMLDEASTIKVAIKRCDKILNKYQEEDGYTPTIFIKDTKTGEIEEIE